MTIREGQNEFCKFLALLINYFYVKGYLISFGEARAYPEDNRHVKNSNHYLGLAIDINLYTNDGSYLKETEDHKIFGEFWESLHPNCRWGGHWSDGNHYEFLTEPRGD